MTEDLSARRAPTIPATAITCNTKGFLWGEYMVRLPYGFIADDLKEPDVWTLVQNSSCSLQAHDRVYLVAYDQSWLAEAIVADADRTSVTLAKPRITQSPIRYDTLLQTEDFRVVWAGIGYVVERKSDNRRMTTPISSKVLAERELWNLTPRAAR